MSEKIEIKVPKLGDLSDVEISEVFVSPGDNVSKEDPLLSLETDKAVMEIPSPADGKIESMTVSPGNTISEGDIIGYLLTKEASENNIPETTQQKKEDDTIETPEKKESEPSSPDESSTPEQRIQEKPADAPYPSIKSGGKYHASPSVRKYARELGADLNQVKGSAPKGRITKDDVKKWIKSSLQGAPVAGKSVSSLPSINIEDFLRLGEVETLKLSKIKKISGSRLQASWQNIPHVTHFDEADITELEKFRKDLNKQLEKEGLKVTILAFIIMAAVKALKEFPSFNASISDDGSSLYLKKYYNIGFAADTPDGLLVPVINHAENMGIKEITAALTDLSRRARERKLENREMTGGTFTISSLGGIGGTGFTPVINPPEAAILGISRSKWQPQWNGTEFLPRLILPFSLSYDHRIIDGAKAARFCRYIAEILTDFRLSAL